MSEVGESNDCAQSDTDVSLPRPWTRFLEDSGFPFTLSIELRMRKASNTIREKPFWWQKFKDPIIADRWKQELLTTSQVRFTEAQIRYIFQELQWYADLRQQQTDQGIQAPIEEAIDGTRRSDGLIPEPLKQRLMVSVDRLANVPDDLKDWHPGSNKQVLDLVHPSLFPAVVGRTRVTLDKKAIPALECVGRGTTLEKTGHPDHEEWETVFSSKTYQWLPTDFKVSAKGKVQILSYINNLHPVEHADMYPILEEVFEKFLPLFEEVLADMRCIWNKKSRLRISGDWSKMHDEYFTAPLWDVFGDLIDEYEDPMDEMWEYIDERLELIEEWWQNRASAVIQVPQFVTPPATVPFNLKNAERPLQVIVKLSNIELTPENPTYKGSAWHVEGMANEEIVATGIYYYHSENVTETRLNFRIQIWEPDFELGHEGYNILYGLSGGDGLNQYLEGIVTKQDRCIAFPNIYQHQVQPFELVDKTKPGKRQILAFFLVDPHRPILSTTQVPPQQLSWAISAGLMDEVNRRLPPELVAQVSTHMSWPMSLIEAKQHREQLMAERGRFAHDVNNKLFERSFRLCEH